MTRVSGASPWLQHPEKVSGILTVAAMLVAFAMVNSPLRPLYSLVHHTPVAIRVGALLVEKPLILWINEGLSPRLIMARSPPSRSPSRR